MTDDDFKRLRDLASAATPGPWKFDGIDIFQLTDAGKGYPLDRYEDSRDVAVGRCQTCGTRDDAIEDVDAAFIAAARSAVPALLDEIERLHTRKDWPFEAAHHDEHHANEDQLRAALVEALDQWEAWASDRQPGFKSDRLDELRKLVQP